jgi:hypothetical protein
MLELYGRTLIMCAVIVALGIGMYIFHQTKAGKEFFNANFAQAGV